MDILASSSPERSIMVERWGMMTLGEMDGPACSGRGCLWDGNAGGCRVDCARVDRGVWGIGMTRVDVSTRSQCSEARNTDLLAVHAVVSAGHDVQHVAPVV